MHHAARAVASAAIAGSLALAGCATVQQVPSKRPMSAENATKAGSTDAAVVENAVGVGKAWFYTSTAGAGASFGLIGAVTTAVIDAIINAGPSSRATRTADELAGAMNVDAINAQMVSEVREEIQASGGATAVSISSVTAQVVAPSQLMETLRSGVPGKLAIVTSYQLSEDASTLKVVGTAMYADPATPWRTPYTFKGSVPKDQLSGPAYRNSFTYFSDAIPAPALTPEFKEKLVAAVEAASRDASGNLPVEGSKEFRTFQREMERARDEEFSKDEIALFLTVEWTKDGGQRLRQHIGAAHDFIARYAVRDINDPSVPSFTGSDERIEALESDRTVRRIGAGAEAGSYVSSPGNVSTFVTFGNTTNFSRESGDRIKRLNDAARAQRKAQ